jgi:hypothetical protein
VKQSLRDGLAQSLREHLPDAVGIVTKGTPVCSIAAALQLVLAMSIARTTVSTVATAAGVRRAGVLGVRRARTRVPELTSDAPGDSNAEPDTLR